MKKVSLLVFLFFPIVLFAFPPGKRFQQLEHGVEIYPDSNLGGNAAVVRILVVSDKILRISATPELDFPKDSSLITVYEKLSGNFKLDNIGDTLFLTTSALTAKIFLPTAAIKFYDSKGVQIVAERQYGGRHLIPAVFQGKRSYDLVQTFETTGDDAYYGLGQHQSGQFDYSGQQVYLFQNNTEVAIPFLLSRKNYGILWDNYSLTKVGDVRDFLRLDKLELTSKNGEPGYLTASYNNLKTDSNKISFIRAESKIEYPFLGDSKRFLPDSFDVQNGVVTWEGSFKSGFEGEHKIKILYGGYMKIWIDGKLLADRWRQAWNPGTALLNISLEKNKAYPIRIQWIPNGTESYLDVTWLNPVRDEDKNTFTFDSEAGKSLDYYFVIGDNADEVIAGYRQLTGKATLVPKWALGFWQSRERYKTQDEVLNTVATFRQRHIPLDNIVQDWSYWKVDDWGSQEFDSARFPSPGQMIRKLHEKDHAQIMISVWPKMYEGITAYSHFNKMGWLYPRNVADRQRDWIGKGYISTFYDAFNTEARKSFWQLISEKLYSKGIDAWWMDASEPDILSNVSPAKRKDQMTPLAAGITAEYVNAYPLENAKGIYFGQRGVDPNKRVFLLTRSGFAGSQHYAAAIWSGDIASRWEDMKAQISAGLNFSMSGLPFWTMDIGGFAVEKRYEKPNDKDLEEWRELQTRWFQFGAFVPLFRSHGQYPYREMFNVAPEDHPAYQSMLWFDKLRYRLMPYLYSITGATYHDDYTIMRGLNMDFPGDDSVRNLGDEYMFGPSLLISPVYQYHASTRRTYLPAGQGWYNLYDGKYSEGGKWVEADAPYTRMPIFVRAGSIIPFGPPIEYVSQRQADTMHLFVYTGKDAQFNLYEDDGLTYDYEKGKYAVTEITYEESTGRLSISAPKGSFPGMLKTRTFSITWINPTHPKQLDLNLLQGELVKYKGQGVTIFKK